MSFSIVNDDDDRDVTPPLDITSNTDPGYDPEAPYGRTKTGRIRKRPVGSTTRAASGRMPATDAMARKAAGVLAQGNALITMGVMMAGFNRTASVLSDPNANAVFEEQAYQALLNDPALCRTILKAGATSGKAALIVAYGMYLAPAMMTAYGELQERRRAIEAADDE